MTPPAQISAPSGAPHARIFGVGGYRPERVVPNSEIVDRINSSDQWIRERSGIISRRWAAPDETVVDMSEAAARQALDAAGLDPSRLGAVLLATVTHPFQTPSAAALLTHRLGATPAAAMDISAACAGFCHGVALAGDMVPAAARSTSWSLASRSSPTSPTRTTAVRHSSSATVRAQW